MEQNNDNIPTTALVTLIAAKPSVVEDDVNRLIKRRAIKAIEDGTVSLEKANDYSLSKQLAKELISNEREELLLAYIHKFKLMTEAELVEMFDEFGILKTFVAIYQRFELKGYDKDTINEIILNKVNN